MSSWELDFSNVPIFRSVVSIGGRGCFEEFMKRLNQEFHFLAPIPRVTYLDGDHSIQALETERDFAKALYAAVTSHHNNLNVFVAAIPQPFEHTANPVQAEMAPLPPNSPNSIKPTKVLTVSPPSSLSLEHAAEPASTAVARRHSQAAQQGENPPAVTNNRELMQVLAGKKKKKLLCHLPGMCRKGSSSSSECEASPLPEPVSYTHLTLPTKRIV
eukprot:TRINITY_DN21560_c0_g1_i1.p1 TRINITY_DN21560_c0_g1~~TRINITY_DN21560_c0_g1_i1.p1  ORF type:complete len:215 (-),score=56.51 TRINITY_DN21560_c0_g1_i1:136-780(-)